MNISSILFVSDFLNLVWFDFNLDRTRGNDEEMFIVAIDVLMFHVIACFLLSLSCSIGLCRAAKRDC